MSAINWTPIYKKYKGLWVALLKDEQTVVGYGKTLKEAKKMACENGHDHPIFTRMPTNLSAFAGGAL
jgi:hypothetical protein